MCDTDMADTQPQLVPVSGAEDCLCYPGEIHASNRESKRSAMWNVCSVQKTS